MSDDREKPILADWANHPGHTLMRQKFLASRDAYYTHLGEQLYRTPDAVSATELKCKAAFFKGALWILNAPVFERQALERAIANREDDGA